MLDTHMSIAVIGMILSLVVVDALAWKTVKHDWG